MERKIIKKMDNLVANEIKAKEELKENKKYFVLLEEKKEINLIKVNKKYEVKEKEKAKEFYIFYFQDKLNESFTSLKKIKTKKEKMYFVVKSFEILLQSLKILKYKNCCHQNINKENISIDFLSNYPKLKNFEYFKKIDEINESDLYNEEIPEIKIINFLLKKKLNTITYESIDEFKDKEEKKYLEKFINKPKEKIIKELKSKIISWDVYCLCKVFKEAVEEIIEEYKLENTFFNTFLEILRKNCCIDGNSRDTVEEIEKKFLILMEKNEKKWELLF